MKELHHRRLSVLNLDKKRYAVLLASLREGHLHVSSDGPRSHLRDRLAVSGLRGAPA
jgi:hypothetical protein